MGLEGLDLRWHTSLTVISNVRYEDLPHVVEGVEVHENYLR